MGQIFVEEVVVFEKSEDSDVGYQAHKEKLLPPFPLGFRNVNACIVIDNYGEKEDQNVDRLKHHVEIAAGDEQQKPPEPVRQQEIQSRYQDEEENEMDGVKKHPLDRPLQEIHEFIYLRLRMCREVGNAECIGLPSTVARTELDIFGFGGGFYLVNFFRG